MEHLYQKLPDPDIEDIDDRVIPDVDNVEDLTPGIIMMAPVIDGPDHPLLLIQSDDPSTSTDISGLDNILDVVSQPIQRELIRYLV